MKIRLGTFNLYQFVEPPYAWYTRKGKFNQRQWLEKTTWVKHQILKMDCDIIGFQEVFSRDALKNLVEELGFNYFETVDVAKRSRKNPYKYVTTTVAIASKYPIVNIEDVKVHTPSIQKHNLQGNIQFSRIPIKATTKLPNGQELLVYVCHLKSNRRNEFEYIFDAQHSFEHKKDLVSKALEGKYAKALRQRLCEASSLFFDIEKSKDKPTVLLCDLNDKEFSITIDALSNNKYHDDTSKENFLLHDPHRAKKVVKRKATSYFRNTGNVLDYIFISNHFHKEHEDKIAKVTDYTVLDHHLEENKDGSLLQSDHAQVVCELTFINQI
ncbi:endonuclease/exonuclease/phosphatase family protein [Sulfurovum sp.]|uniref:endonuclease/exonuclease/phosphatase family protein n=1 Tax=Sulfurovum sp. TaxID=1969726 RepID=UPI0028682937|nr:endonuclease/exonuclease/phosphatase family protein [Sulfurovum sp.]